MRILFLLGLIFISYSFSQKEYVKDYYTNGNLKEEGWVLNNQKTDYWFFYHENGLKKEEGHYLENQKVNWWIYYDNNQNILKKCQFKFNQLNGFSILYNNGEVIKAEKYIQGKKVKTWHSLTAFKNDNPLLF
jgi:antitoxin component YwqK of YwqJK toxin-antitoxin module